jgi:two-component system response regulator DctR
MTAPRLWQVLIVEDDPVISSIYRRTVEAMGPVTVAGVVTRGEDAVAFLQHKDVDLLLLDLTLAGMSGLTLLQRLRTAGSSVEVIALTATRDASVVRAVVQRGAIDYLVKPFTMERLRQAVGLFLHRASATRHGELDQQAIDVICASGRSPRRWLPKGLTDDGVARVKQSLGAAPDGWSAVDVAADTGLARVTARRYLEYLVSSDQASVDAYPSGPGRPRKVYRALAPTTL